MGLKVYVNNFGRFLLRCEDIMVREGYLETVVHVAPVADEPAEMRDERSQDGSSGRRSNPR
jgi:hypothetical protein